jgi:hypothetical protein
MKHQSMKDRMHEGEGMVRHEMKHKMHHSEKHHHDGHHKHSMHHMHESAHGIYKNQVEMPELAPMGHMEHGYGCMEFKGEADSIAMGQSGPEGAKSDEHKIHSQMKQYHWD